MFEAIILIYNWFCFYIIERDLIFIIPIL
jgi:hypothetical protein